MSNSTLKRTEKRRAAAEKRRTSQMESALREEAKAEELAPAATRLNVTDATGAIIRAARLERSGVGFIRANPLAHLSRENGIFRAVHVAAAHRLIVTFDAVGEGVGLGASKWGDAGRASGVTPTTPQGYSSLLAQVGQRQELQAAHAFVGALWPCLDGIILHGMSFSVWAQRGGMDRKAAPGYLLAALDRLAEFYKARDVVPAGRNTGRIRTVEFVKKTA